jgi:hypothetical protein
MGVLVEPKPDSYVTEWEAVQFDPTGYNRVKGILRNSPWLVQLRIDGPEVVVTRINTGTAETWTIKLGDWVVRSPHGRYWFMSNDEFVSQFNVVAE